VGGVIVLVALAVGILIFLRRRKQRRNAGGNTGTSGNGGIQELPDNDTMDAKELPAGLELSEVADNERDKYQAQAAKYQDPVELPAQ
jgi:hypothetical protein